MISKNCDVLCKLLLTIRKISGGPIHGGPTHGRILLLDMEVSSASGTFVKKCEHSNDCQLLPHSDQHLSPPRCPCPQSPWGGLHPSLLKNCWSRSNGVLLLGTKVQQRTGWLAPLKQGKELKLSEHWTPVTEQSACFSLIAWCQVLDFPEIFGQNVC